MKRIALSHSHCGIPKVVEVCHFVLLFSTCNITSFRTIFITLSSSGSINSHRSLYECSLLMVSNAFITSSNKMWVEYSLYFIAFSHSIFIVKTCSVVLLPFLYDA